MTSKEALNQLYVMADTPELAMIIQSYYNIVEKDLEVLEIFRKQIGRMPEDNIEIYLLNFNDEEFKKVKEWLENEE